MVVGMVVVVALVAGVVVVALVGEVEVIVVGGPTTMVVVLVVIVVVVVAIIVLLVVVVVVVVVMVVVAVSPLHPLLPLLNALLVYTVAFACGISVVIRDTSKVMMGINILSWRQILNVDGCPIRQVHMDLCVVLYIESSLFAIDVDGHDIGCYVV